MKTIYIVRHGETDFNFSNIVQGKGINAPLNVTGRKQAHRFCQHYASVPFDYVFTSTLRRTQQTVLPFIRKGLPWQPMHYLDEIGWGELEGKPSDEVRPRLHQLITGWKDGLLHEKINGGESPLELQHRHRRFIQHYRALPHKNILVCTHGRAMRILLSTMLDTPLTEMDQYHHRNTSVYKLVDDGRNVTPVLLNNVDHLDAAILV